MSGRVLPFNPNRFRCGSTSIDLNTYKSITAGSVNSETLDRFSGLLRHRQGESPLHQDIKRLVLCRLICETHSVGRFSLTDVFEQLFCQFPQPPELYDYLVPVEHESGDGRAIIESCRPRPTDSPAVLRVKKMALILNLTQLVQATIVEISGVVNPMFDQATFRDGFSWVWEILRDFPATAPQDAALNDLIQTHVFEPGLPFNIQLPEKK